MTLEITRDAETERVPPDRIDDLAEDGRVPVADLLGESDEYTHATFEASGYRASIPLDVAREQGVLLLQDDGLRLVVEDGATLCWNVKQLERIRLTRGPEPDSVPENPTH